MLKRLRLINWKSHEDSEFHFSKGTNLIIGSIGSGKSSVIDGICFSLFGTFPTLKSKKILIEEVITQRPVKKSHALLELDFEVHGKNYSITRKISSKGSEAFLREEGKLLEGPQTQRVNEVLVKILKIDYELFTRVIYSEQNKIDYFLVLGKGERKKQIDELLGISKFESARSGTATVLNKIKETKKEIQSFLEGIGIKETLKEVDALEKEILDLENSISCEKEEKEKESISAKKVRQELEILESKQKESNELSKKAALIQGACQQTLAEIDKKRREVKTIISFEKLVEERKKTEKEIIFLEKVRQELFEAKATLEMVSRELASVEQYFLELKEVAEKNESQEKKELEKIVEKKRELEKRIEELQKKVSEKQSEIASKEFIISRLSLERSEFEKIERKISEINAFFKGSLEKELEKTEYELKKENQELTTISAEILENNNSVFLLSNQKEGCPICGSHLSEEKRKNIVKEKKKNLEKLESRKKEILEAISRLQEHFSKISKAIEEKNKLLEKSQALKESSKNLSKINDERNKAIEEKDSLEKQISELKKMLAEEVKKEEKKKDILIKISEFNKKKEFKEELNKRKKEVEEKIFSLSKEFSQQKLEEEKNKLKEIEASAEIYENEKRLAELQKEFEGIEKRINEIAFDEKTLDEKREKLLSFEKNISRLSESIQRKHSILSEKRNKLEELTKIKKIVEEKESELKEINWRVEQLTLFQNALIETQRTLREELVASINEVMKELWTNLYPYGDYKSARMTALEDDYSLELETLSGEWISAEEASGGEKSCVSLSLRIAFAMVLAPGLGWLVLDEPTHNLDSETISSLSSMLREEIPKIVQQTFVITHDEMLKESASAKIYLIERDKEKGEKSVVQEISGE